MSRTYKDKYYGAWYWKNFDWSVYTKDWIYMRVGEESKRRKMVFKRTNGKLRRYKGEVGQNGWYRKPFGDMWDIW